MVITHVGLKSYGCKSEGMINNDTKLALLMWETDDIRSFFTKPSIQFSACLELVPAVFGQEAGIFYMHNSMFTLLLPQERENTKQTHFKR